MSKGKSKCTICQENVYLVDKLEIEDKTYHKSCFKCKNCKKLLDLSDFRKHENDIYCKKHYTFIVNPNFKSEKTEEIEIKEEKFEKKIDFKKWHDLTTNIIKNNNEKNEKKENKQTVTIKTKQSKCHICNEQVFQIDKIEIENLQFHKVCFKCCDCNKNLTLNDFRKFNEKIYCVKHYKFVVNPNFKLEHIPEDPKKKKEINKEIIIEKKDEIVKTVEKEEEEEEEKKEKEEDDEATEFYKNKVFKLINLIGL
jgi:cysteine/glycine-rich protein